MKYILIVRVSVPIRGLFNLTIKYKDTIDKDKASVSVPIRGLFNLTTKSNAYEYSKRKWFPSPSGDYLI